MTLTPPTTSLSTFIPRFCKYLNTEIVLVRQKSGKYSKFQFNYEKNQFRSIECPDCRVIPEETDLFPLYPVWSNALRRHIIFAKNRLNGRIEQYIYDKDYEGFQQVFDPELEYDRHRFHRAADIFTVGESAKEGVTVIKRDMKGWFRKEQMDWATSQLKVIPAVPVKILEISEGSWQKEQKFQRNFIRMAFRPRKNGLIEETVPNAKNNKQKVVEELESVPAERNETELSQNWTPEVEIIDNKSKLTKKDVIEIRRLAALMGNPTEQDSSDETDSSGPIDYDDVPDEMFDVLESSC